VPGRWATSEGSIGAGGTHTCAIATAGELFCWGDDNYGQLGDGDGVTGGPEPRPVASPLRFSEVASGARVTCAITAERTLYCWGANNFGQLGTGDTTERPAPARVCLPPPRDEAAGCD
jgi:alpha-tubulin suppressor-like RCC1 family protein